MATQAHQASRRHYLSVDMPVASCPSTSVGADIVMSRCAISVLAGAQWFQAETFL